MRGFAILVKHLKTGRSACFEGGVHSELRYLARVRRRAINGAERYELDF